MIEVSFLYKKRTKHDWFVKISWFGSVLKIKKLKKISSGSSNRNFQTFSVRANVTELVRQWGTEQRRFFRYCINELVRQKPTELVRQMGTEQSPYFRYCITEIVKFFILPKYLWFVDHSLFCVQLGHLLWYISSIMWARHNAACKL